MHEDTCVVDGCASPVRVRSRGWCSKHYDRWRKTGRLDLPSSEERFWAKVDKDGPVPAQRPDLGGCWLWTGTRNPAGYGGFQVGSLRKVAHRWAYEYSVGPIAEGLVLDHLCRNPSCVNPAHLEPVTPSENILRGLRKTRTTHCPQGHPYEGDNLFFTAGGRACRECKRADERRRYWAKRGGQPRLRASAYGVPQR